MATYQVKKGDTLSGIAASQGVKLSDISGYRSGNPDLIYEGETLNIGVPETKTGSTKELSDAMAEEYGEADDTSGSDATLTKYREDYDSYKTKRDDAFQSLKGITTDTFNSEYDSRKLEEKKQKIETLDGDIASLRAARDADLNEVRKNPNLSASQMTGDVKKQADFYNAQINNLINERNSVAGEYNSELDEIDRIVQNAVTDAQAEYAYYDGLFNEAGTNISSYESALREELLADQEQDNFERQLEQALTIAQMKGTGSGGGSDDNWKLVYDDYGQPLYWFNSATKEIEYINGDDNPGGGNTGGGSFDDLEAELDNEDGGSSDFVWWNPKTWF